MTTTFCCLLCSSIKCGKKKKKKKKKKQKNKKKKKKKKKENTPSSLKEVKHLFSRSYFMSKKKCIKEFLASASLHVRFSIVALHHSISILHSDKSDRYSF